MPLSRQGMALSHGSLPLSLALALDRMDAERQRDDASDTPGSRDGDAPPSYMAPTAASRSRVHLAQTDGPVEGDLSAGQWGSLVSVRTTTAHLPPGAPRTAWVPGGARPTEPVTPHVAAAAVRATRTTEAGPVRRTVSVSELVDRLTDRDRYTAAFKAKLAAAPTLASPVKVARAAVPTHSRGGRGGRGRRPSRPVASSSLTRTPRPPGRRRPRP